MARVSRTRKEKESELNRDRLFLQEAMKEAEKCLKIDEVPVGAIIVHSDEIIARAHNLREKKQLATCHAEIEAITQASEKLGSWRLYDCDVFVTLEPCPMCAAALQQARVRRVVYGAKDPKGGAVSLRINLHRNLRMNHRYEMKFLKTPVCGEILSDFFRQKRYKS